MYPDTSSSSASIFTSLVTHCECVSNARCSSKLSDILPCKVPLKPVRDRRSKMAAVLQDCFEIYVKKKQLWLSVGAYGLTLLDKKARPTESLPFSTIRDATVDHSAIHIAFFRATRKKSVTIKTEQVVTSCIFRWLCSSADHCVSHRVLIL
jgi:hypothetical protein